MNKERNCTSKNIRSVVAKAVFCLLPELEVAAAAVADADSCVVEDVVREGPECLW